MSHDHSRSWSFYLVKYEPRSLTFSSRSLANHNKNYVIGQNICLKWMQNRNICFYILNWNGNLFLVKLLEEIGMGSYFQAYFWQILAHKMNLKWTKKWTELGQKYEPRSLTFVNEKSPKIWARFTNWTELNVNERRSRSFFSISVYNWIWHKFNFRLWH